MVLEKLFTAYIIYVGPVNSPLYDLFQDVIWFNACESHIPLSDKQSLLSHFFPPSVLALIA